MGYIMHTMQTKVDLSSMTAIKKAETREWKILYTSIKEKFEEDNYNLKDLFQLLDLDNGSSN